MELGKLNTLRKQIIDEVIKEAKTFEPKEDAGTRLKKAFDECAKAENLPAENGNIDDMLGAIKTKREGLDKGVKPSMGLERAEEIKAQSEEDNKIAKEEKDTTQISVDENNDKAKENFAITKENSSREVSEAEASCAETKDSAAEMNIQAENKESDARDDREFAEKGLDDSQTAVSEASSTLAEAKSEAGAAESEEAQVAAEEKVNEAEDALEQAEEQEEAAQEKVEDTVLAEGKAEENTASVKADGEEKVKAAEEKQDTVQAEADKSVSEAKENVANVEKDGKEKMASAEEKVDTTKKDGEETTYQALEKAAKEAKDARESGEAFPSRAETRFAELQKHSVEGEKIAKDIFNTAKESDKIEDTKEVLSEINTDNVVNTIEKYKEANPERSLTDLVYNQKGSKEEKIEALNSIQEKLINKSDQYNIDNRDLISRYEQTIESGKLSSDEINEIEAINNEYISRIKEAENSETKKVIDVHNSNKNIKSDLEGACTPREKKGDIEGFRNSEYVKDNAELHDLDTSDLYGNGKFDTKSVQLRGNCWNHATVDSMTVSERGSEYINSLITKKDGITAISLPAARVDDDPENDVFSFTEGQIITGSIPVKSEKNDMGSYSLGDGDMTAFNTAVHKYLNNTENENEIYNEYLTPRSNSMDGNSLSRGFEIISGEKSKIFYNGEIPDGVGETGEINEALYSNIKELFDNKEAAFTADIYYNSERDMSDATLVDKDDFEKSVDGEPLLVHGHAYSVRGIDDGYIYLGESNNPSTCIKMSKKEFLQFANQVASFKF